MLKHSLSGSITWLSRGSLEGAAILLLLGKHSITFRTYLRAGGIEQKSKHDLTPVLHKPSPLMQGVVLTISSLPFLIGFVVPVMLLIVFAVGRFDNATNLFSPAIRSILLASITAIIVVGIGLFLSFLTRINAPGWFNRSIQTASLGYAIPGTVLGLGVLIVLSQFDNFSSQFLNLSFLPILSGSVFAVIFAYSLRFLDFFRHIRSRIVSHPQNHRYGRKRPWRSDIQLLRLVHHRCCAQLL